MPTFRVKGRFTSSWVCYEPQHLSSLHDVDVTIEADNEIQAKDMAMNNAMDEEAKYREEYDCDGATSERLSVSLVGEDEIAEIEAEKEAAKLREDVRRHAVGMLFPEMA